MKFALKPLLDFNDLSFEEQVAQILIVRASGYLFAHQRKENDDDPVATCLTLLQSFIRGNLFRGSTGLSSVTEERLKILLRNKNLQTLIIYGKPYVLEQFLADLPPATPYVFSSGQMLQAQAIALNVLFRDRLPVKTFTQFI